MGKFWCKRYCFTYFLYICNVHSSCRYSHRNQNMHLSVLFLNMGSGECCLVSVQHLRYFTTKYWSFGYCKECNSLVYGEKKKNAHTNNLKNTTRFFEQQGEGQSFHPNNMQEKEKKEKKIWREFTTKHTSRST